MMKDVCCNTLLLSVLSLAALRSVGETHEVLPLLSRRTCDQGHTVAAQVAGVWTDHGRTSGNGSPS